MQVLDYLYHVKIVLLDLDDSQVTNGTKAARDTSAMMCSLVSVILSNPNSHKENMRKHQDCVAVYTLSD